MSSIHYKFRATLEYKTLQFDGLHITGADLKKEICAKEGIKAEAFDLLLQNAHTKRSYTAEELIPRNSSIIVQRVPREDAEKLPKIQGVNTGVVVRSSTAETGMVPPAPMSTEEFEKLSEEDQIAHIKDVSTAKYHSSNFQKKTTNIMSGPPPPTYTCNRCYQPGHWYKNCPMVITIAARMRLLVAVTEEGPAVERVPPQELTCPICSHLLKDAVLTTCCGHSFCADCISNKLMESPDRQCPGKNCDQKQLSVDALVPNKTVRQAALAWSVGASGPGNHDHDQMRFRIGLQPTVVSSASTPPQPLTAAVAHTLTSTTSTISHQTDSLHTQTSPNPFTIAPPVAHSVPTSFSHPPPNMVPVVSASSSSSGDSLLPHVATSLPPPSMNLPISHAMHTNSTLPPIPGIGLPLQTHNMLVPGTGQPAAVYSFNQPPPVSTINLGPPQPQIMDAWDAFLHRKDRERERPRKRVRSRIRSSSSSSSFSSGDDRRKRRDRHDREKRRDQRNDKQRDRDRARDSRYWRGEERGNRDRERDREWSDRHRENRLHRSGGYSSRVRDGKEEPSLPSLMGLDVTTPPNLNPICEKRDRSRSRSKSPQNVHSASGMERRRRKKKDSRWKNDQNWRFRRSEKERKSRKINETDDAAREVADEEAIDGTLREIAEFVRVEANCDDDGIEFDIEDAVVKDTVTEAEDERSVTDTDPPPDDTANPPPERMSGAENEEPVEHHLESEDVEVTKEDIIDKPQDVEEKVEEVETKGSSRRKDKKHKKHKKHKKQREGDDDISSESKHRHKRRKEKKEKRKKEKRHRRDKNYDTDELIKVGSMLLLKDCFRCSNCCQYLLDGVKNYSEERRGYDNVCQRKSDFYGVSRDSRKHNEKDKSELSKRHEEKQSGRSRRERDRSVDKRYGDKVFGKDDKCRNRSRERDMRKSKDHSNKRRDSDSNVDRESENRQRGDRKVESGYKEHFEKHEKNDRLSDRSRNEGQRSVALSNPKERDMTKIEDVKPSQFVTKEAETGPRDIEASDTTKQRVLTTMVNDDEPLVKKEKADVAIGSSASTPVKPAPASTVKFKVKVPPVLKLSGVDKESTDIEEDKTKLPVDDNSGGGDPRMREAFSPPKLQRKKITLNL
ncbi:hypothetical protein Angca_009895 [Angiostrongylus cantonensis]|nr:hypothetical protein Angca_009895 [Angiostrongylus cantonensis]